MWYWKGELPKHNKYFEARNMRFFAKMVGTDNMKIEWVTPEGRGIDLLGWIHPSDKSLHLDGDTKWRREVAEATCEWRSARRKTNRQWLAKMSDEELATFFAQAEGRVAGPARRPYSLASHDDWLKWLKEEHKE